MKVQKEDYEACIVCEEWLAPTLTLCMGGAGSLAGGAGGQRAGAAAAVVTSAPVAASTARVMRTADHYIA